MFEPLASRRVYYQEPPGNVGDALIHAGARQLFAARGIPLVALPEADAIALGGGGNWSLYPEARLSRDRVLQARPGNIPIVVFPQSIYSLEEPLPAPPFHFHVREAASLERVPGAILSPDTALAFHPPTPLPEPLFESGVLLRKDPEGRFREFTSLGDPIEMVGPDPLDYVRSAAHFARIYTDRLHFAISGLLAGRSVTLLGNSYHKNRSMWETWLRNAGCQWAETPPTSTAYVSVKHVPTPPVIPGPRIRKDVFPSIAVTMCLHNEDRFLEENLRYHHALGVRKAYLYLDECTDRSAEIIKQFPWAEAIDRPCPRGTTVLHAWQNSCANEALQRARDDGFEWLLQIDPDEFAFGGNPLPKSLSSLRNSAKRNLWDRVLPPREHRLQHKAHLGRMLAGVPPHIAQVILRTKESVPVSFNGQADFSFWANPYFQDKKPLHRRILNPISGETRDWHDFLGHTLGKPILRTSVAAQALNPHRWTPDQAVKAPSFPLYFPLPSIRRGWHYHFLLVSPAHWLKKFRRESTLALTWEDGREVEFPKMAWRMAGSALSLEAASRYLEEWVFLRPADADALASEGKLIRDDSVSRILTEVCGYPPLEK